MYYLFMRIVDQKGLGLYIASRLSEFGGTITSFAEQFGLTRAAASQLVNGDRAPSDRTLAKFKELGIVRVYEVPDAKEK